MKERNLLNAMGGIDYRYIADAAPSGRKHKRRNLAMVASLCLLLAATLLFKVIPTSIAGTVPIINGASTTLSHSLLSSSSGSSSGISASRPRTDFEFGLLPFVVEGRILEISPDIYTALPANGSASQNLKKYHLLKVQLIDTVIGEGIPQEFYYQFPADYTHPDLLKYDSFIFVMSQIGMEDYILLNTHTNTYETFSMVFELRSDLIQRGGLLAFTDGKLDVTLWTTVWGRKYSSFSKYLSDESSFPIKSWHNTAQAKRAIRSFYDLHDHGEIHHTVASKSDFESEQAKAALAYIQPFKNGVFYLGLTYGMRIINGYPTTEVMRIYPDRVEYKGEAFTQQDLMNLPDINKIFEQNDFSSIAPPHTPYYKLLKQTAYGTDAWYTKVNGKVYGIVKVYWNFCLPSKSSHKPSPFYYDDIYIIAYPDGRYHTIGREKLRELIGSDATNANKISTREYNKPFKWE